jgi:hypothetical protein
MPEYITPPNHTFCWDELMTTDLEAGQRFYASLLGWSLAPMPGDFPYVIAQVGGKNVAGLTVLPEKAKAMGAPPHWNSYIAVEDVKASTDRAAGLGARVLVPPSPMGPGTFSIIADPTGAVVSLWHTTQSMGTLLYGEPGSRGWNELMTSNVDVAQKFYGGLFGWTAERQPNPDMTYYVFKQGGQSVGGMMPIGPDMKGATPHWGVYFMVTDADAAFDKAQSLGAKVVVPLMTVPGVGRFGYLADPQGVSFAVMKGEPAAK